MYGWFFVYRFVYIYTSMKRKREKCVYMCAYMFSTYEKTHGEKKKRIPYYSCIGLEFYTGSVLV